MTSPTLDLRTELTDIADRLERLSTYLASTSLPAQGALSLLDAEISRLHDLLDTLNAQDGRRGPLLT